MGKVIPHVIPKHQGGIDAVRVTQGVFLVMVHVAPGTPGDPNVEIIAAKLRRGDAERVVQQIPGAWIEKVQADK